MVNDKQIVLFDGTCNLCNRTVSFITKRDKKGQFRFSPLHSEEALRLLEGCGLTSGPLTSIVLLEGGRCYRKSTAALRIARHLRFPWLLLYALIAIPPFLRDWVYEWVARNRYRWFGRRDSCPVPTKEP